MGSSLTDYINPLMSIINSCNQNCFYHYVFNQLESMKHRKDLICPGLYHDTCISSTLQTNVDSCSHRAVVLCSKDTQTATAETVFYGFALSSFTLFLVVLLHLSLIEI